MYSAIVSRIANIRPIEGADNIVLAEVASRQVVVGKDSQVGDLGIFFPTDGQLSEEFCRANDLIERKDANGNRAGGMFSTKRRVRSIKLRGVVSDGFFCPVSHLSFTGDSWKGLTEGFEFSTFAGVPICNKYETPATIKNRNSVQGVKIPKTVLKMFHEHVDTAHFVNNYKNIPVGALITVTSKCHGTSHRVSRCLSATPFTTLPLRIENLKIRIPRSIPKFIRLKISRCLEKIGILQSYVPSKESWQIVHGTRRAVILTREGGYYGSYQFRLDTISQYATDRLKKGETIYGEIVGYSGPETPIMSHSTEVFKSKPIEKKFGKKFNYSYGCKPGEAKFLVYRITMTNEDGDSVEYPWPKVKARCEELKMETVPEVYPSFIFDGDYDKLLNDMSVYVDGSLGGCEILPSLLDSHPREGIVIRADGISTNFYKYKSRAFGIMEGYIKDRDDYVDIEESES